jgi:hypothetical protein
LPFPRRRGVGRHLQFARDHHFGRLDNRDRVVSPPQFQLVNRVAGDDRGQRLIADSQSHLAEQAVAADLFHVAAQAVASAQGDDQARRARCSRDRGAGRRSPGRQPVDLDVGNPVVTARGLRGPHAALINPLLERRIADAQPRGGGANGQKCHDAVIP